MRDPRAVFRTTPRLLLCRPGMSDLSEIVSLWTDPQVTAFIGGPREASPVLDFFREFAADFEAAQERWGDRWWTIVEWASDRFVGLVSLVAKEIEGQDEVELGYFLLPFAWGRGFALEAAREVCDYAFGSLGLKSLVALIDPENSRSQAVATRLGMVLDHEILREDGTIRRLHRLLPEGEPR